MNSYRSSSRSRRSAPCRQVSTRSSASACHVLLAALLVGSAPGGIQAQTVSTSGGANVTSVYVAPAAPIQPSTPFFIENPHSDSSPLPGTDRPRYPGMERDLSRTAAFGPDNFGPFLLPPLPPVLGEPRDPDPAALTAPAWSFPAAMLAQAYANTHWQETHGIWQPGGNHAALADYAGEIYYIALSYLGSPDLLANERRERIERYRDGRRSVLEALRTQLNRLKDLPADRRQAELAGLAGVQTSLLLAQETEAEAIRRDLTENGFFKTAAPDIGRFTPEAVLNADVHQAQIRVLSLLSAAQFQRGPALEQRLLLQEVCLETALAAGPPGPVDKPYVLFWPAGTRLRLPANLAPALTTKLAELQALKAGLKKELTEVVELNQRSLFAMVRTEAYVRLATAQAARFQRLDALAEEIRRDLAALPADPSLPAGLADRVGAVAARRTALQRDLYARVNEFRGALPDRRVELVKKGAGVALVVTPSFATGDQTDETVRDQLRDFGALISQRFADMNREADAVRAAIEQYRSATPGLAERFTVDQLTAELLAAHQMHLAVENQRDYTDAVLTPGLSPAQRRLLFAAAGTAFARERLPAGFR